MFTPLEIRKVVSLAERASPKRAEKRMIATRETYLRNFVVFIT
jgi:hypothetical protein